MITQFGFEWQENAQGVEIILMRRAEQGSLMRVRAPIEGRN